MSSFPDLLAGFDPDALRDSRSSIAALDASGTFLWVNRAWRRRAEAFGVPPDPRGTSYFDGIGEDLRGHFVTSFAAALATRALFELDYECPSPEEQRLFRLRVLPLDAGVLVEHALVSSMRVGESLRVLVVDDDANLRRAIVRALQRAQHVVDACEDAATALVQLRSAEYDVLLTDLVMPGLSGLELLVEARRERPGLHCLVMSGSERVEQAGADVVWLTKPIDLETLYAAIQR